MPDTKRIVILANSDKPGGRCVAGIELSDPPQLIRPVSARLSQELSWDERRYEDGTEPALLDLVDIRITQHLPTTVQQENWLIDPTGRWVKVGHLGARDLDNLVYSQTGPLWANEGSSRNGLRNRFSQANALGAKDSLRLLKPSELSVHVEDGWNGRELNGEFTFDGSVYKLRITDPEFTGAWAQAEHGTYAIEDAYVTVSVTEPFLDGNHYKVIAAIIEKGV
ncbi:MAG: hypothetical protein R3C39_10365 [Dehalococcoidia bacterium]